MTLLTVKNLAFKYPDKEIIKNLSFSVESGDFICIIGTNGTGKSTLLRLMLNRLTPSSGEIAINGVEVSKFKDYGSIAYVSQRATAFNRDFPATAEEIVGLGLCSRKGLFKKLNAKDRQKVASTLKRVGMSEYAKKQIGLLSGGQQQRIFIAKALVSQPEILFLDEPTVGIDNAAVDSICCLLGELNKQENGGLTIVMVTHDISSTICHANKVLRITEDGGGSMLSAEEYVKAHHIHHNGKCQGGE